MRREEAELIGELLDRPEFRAASVVLELGSADTTFREVTQPHIARNIHHRLAARGVRVVTTDIKDGEGIDLVGDIFEPATQEQLRSLQPSVVLCCNIFEHIVDRRAFAAACDSLVPRGGFMVVTVPYSYPYHLDPLDTMFRPAPEDIAELFPGYRLAFGRIIDAGTYRDDMGRHGTSIGMQFLRTLVRGVWPWRGVEALKARWHRWLWIGRPFRQSIALLHKPADG